jgi:hypothetical protein
MAKKEFALLYFESGATSFYVWFESRIIPFHAGQPEKERSVRENGAALVVFLESNDSESYGYIPYSGIVLLSALKPSS